MNPMVGPVGADIDGGAAIWALLPAKNAAEPVDAAVHRLPTARPCAWADAATMAGWLPDAWHAAAWAWLRHRWLSDTRWLECGPAAGPSFGTFEAAGALPKSHDWIAAIDAARRAAQPAAEHIDDLHWQGVPTGVGQASVGPDGQRPRLGTDADGLFLYDPLGRIDAAMAVSWLAAIDEVAAQLRDMPHADLSALASLTTADRLRQLEQFNAPLPALDETATVHGVFSQMVRQHADALAVIDGPLQWTYAELDRQASRIAAALMRDGVQHGERVGLLMERSAPAIAALLGILRAGACYVPIQPDFPAERIAWMLRDAGVRTLLLPAQALAPDFLPEGVRARPLDTLVADAPQHSASEPAASGDAGAYVMYTSGSTGQPKGIEILHSAILRLVIAPNFMRLHAGDRILHAAPLGFDASTLEIWGPLLTGGCCVVHGEKIPTAQGLQNTIATHRVRSAWLTAALFNAVVDDDPAHLQGLEQLLVGGEALSVPHVRRAQQALPHTTLINGYGPTECTTFAATLAIERPLAPDVRSIPIGRPINATVLRVLSRQLALLPSGMVGELCIGGHGLARGYLKRPELDQERFVADPFGRPGERLYRTGDLARWLPDGTVEYLGRMDDQVKIRGHRIELGEIESCLLAHPAVRSAAVIARADDAGQLRLIAYVVAKEQPASWSALREYLLQHLPEAFLPSALMWLDQLPVTTNGKLDRKALPEPTRNRPDLAQPYQEPRGATELRVCEAFGRVLGLDRVGRLDNFFDLGGDSLRVQRVLADLKKDHPAAAVSANLFFRQPTPQALAKALDASGAATAAQEPSTAPVSQASADAGTARSRQLEPIALVAMAGRFPGAADVEALWDNLLAGRDTITVFDDATLDAGVSAALRSDPDYVKARGVIDGVENFDAAFFGINPKEAELMDPQQRLFLELCWECMERGGHAPDRCERLVGVWGGMYNATYFQRHLSTRPDLIEAVGEFQVMLGNEKDYIASRVAHKLNLRGPAVAVHTACSTSLVAVHEAFRALQVGDCDMALAGGVAITCPPRSGYLYNEGSMLSPDGHTRTFDHRAQGTVFSDGAAVVLLKRLSDALADGDPIHAVLRGTAINNDGGAKASFTAPSVDGQAQVITAALANAGVDPRSISYVEAHGTATPMGDPVELEALTQAWRRYTADNGFCRIGSLKSNVGHMVMAAGASGLIKTALSLEKEQLPASLHYESPNPSIDFAATPFVVNDRLTDWPRAAQPRRAAVSAFGVGGTNAHVIVEEAPLRAPSQAGEGPHLLQLSARTPTALAAACERMAAHLQANPQIALADVAHTLRVGRTPFAHRAVVVADAPADAATAWRTADAPRRAHGATGARVPETVFMFPGQGAQYAGMGRTLYASGRAPRAAFDDVLQCFEGVLPFDLSERMFSPDPSALAPTSVTQPATFAIEYVLARQMLALGVEPKALVGHSVGEFAAAVLAGVMRLEDAARLVAQRGALMQAQPAGVMLSVRMPAEQLQARLPADVSLAADNGPQASVAAGPASAIDALRAALEADGVVARVLQTSHAFHSAMMDPAIEPFQTMVEGVALAAPSLPLYSTLTGRLLTASEATDPRYWARHLREAVRFSPAVREVMGQLPAALFIELGPRNTLSTLVRQHGGSAIPTLADTPAEEAHALRLAAGRLWAVGADIDLGLLDEREDKRRLCLPTYPFERKRCWVDIATASPMAVAAPFAATAPSTPATPTPTPANPEPTMTAASTDRRADLTQRLRTLFEDISGIDLAQADPASPFVELGLDSLTLTQAAMQVKKTFKVNVTFRQLMENHRSFGALAELLDASLPAEPQAAPAVAAPQAAVAQPAAQAAIAIPATAMPIAAVPIAAMPAADGSLVQQVIAQQMQLMQQQLALLSGGMATQQAAPAATQPAVPQVVASAPAAVAAPASAQAQPATVEEPQGAIKYDVKKAFGAIARIHTQNKDITERQKARLSAFMRRYTERTAKSKEFTAANRPHMADPRVVNGFRPITKEITYQLVMDRTKGSRMWDLDGNEYVDVLNGFGMNLFGWQPDFVQEAVRRQLDAGYEIGPQHPLAADVTRLICELTGFDRAALCNTGSESVMAAVRIARTVTGRNTVVLFTGSYHGTFDEVLVRAGRNAKGLPAAPGIMSGMFGDVRVLEYGTPESLQFIRDNADDLAAVLVEVVQSRRPDFQPREFVREVRAITEQSGTCLIFDEVITGFRSHLHGVQALFDVRADLACYGKVIGGGFPVGVIAGKRQFMDSLDGGAWQYGDDSIPSVGVTYFAGTFVRHPLALAACKASLEHLKEAGEGLQTQLNLHTAAMADELTAFCREVGAPIEIRYFSSLWRVTWLEDHPLQDLLFAMMRSRGVHILDNFPCFMTTAHTHGDIALIKQAFKESVAEMQEAEFLPRLARKDAGVFDASKPPVPGARLGRDANGKAAWFVPNPEQPGKYMLVR
ncbi:amino acid adenylation domain-containing protein [Variovorax dokdonensis]|uniref:Amino acid adenylation domain-containing protein n=1 Tax=Variovorax dokdonensis TaxID=344883 RepID=A0ABT7N5L7_9BURK|nr:polyketide synthase [Variovorax dokdonensis]MDM0043202.1 amino acid adenylation domain-containing protein [Variovorax dokdonensis]